jgi:hypothetical protein
MFAAAPTVAARINHRLNFSVFLFSTRGNAAAAVTLFSVAAFAQDYSHTGKGKAPPPVVTKG